MYLFFIRRVHTFLSTSNDLLLFICLGHGRHVVVACRRAGGGGRVPVLVRRLGRGARALAHRRRVLGHARAEPGLCTRGGPAERCAKLN